MDRFSMAIERQEQVEEIIREWGFLPFFKNGIEGFSIEEMTPPELLFGDDFNQGPWGWKGPIIAKWESAYGKFFKGKAGYVSLEWLPDFINWRRSAYPLKKQSMSWTTLIIIYLLAINAVTFVVYGIDKIKAKRAKWRIPEATLLLQAAIGGSIGAWLGMKVWHHKTLHKKFRFGVPAILVAQIAVAIHVLTK